ncbi:unnamed protein product (macronuclear) [Paramecium tetraurelia]|uniref:Uncharacterized protein n=1 Tax=Paramecium tetraurelia TaxID=5888 RepID=A0BG44_PARTE|nr:uncharacterized protein GSPATT00028546001 [Paramecium tetraurelia]CAK57511.1 unnamed protein product [Paramecium tetraurelia]|eukprot:XP_001424909.1 hypothetical protein (macronuclear) [Paramecium tetraurelia strain d4-2]
MGCVSSDEQQTLAFDDFQFLRTGTLSIELTQLIFVVNNLLKEVRQLYKQINSNRIILFRITKVSLTTNQTVLDAFGFWTRFVSICNLGQGKQNGVYYKLDDDEKSLSYNLGLNGDLKLQWFGEVLNDYFKVLIDITACIPMILEQLKFLQDKINQLGANLKEKNPVFKYNMSLLKFNLDFTKIANIRIVYYNQEIEIFKRNYIQIAEAADEQGLKLYRRFGAKQSNDVQKYRMQVKINLIMEQCFHGEMRPEIEQETQNKQKEKRKALKPAWTFGDDIGIGVKKFPFRVRWTGCNCVDHSFFIISNYLENHSKHLLLLRKLSVILRYLTQSYKTDEDTLSRAWFIFCTHLSQKERNIIQSNSSILNGLKKFKLRNSDAEKCRNYFIKYIEQLDPDYLSQFQDEWQNYIEGQSKVLSLWSNNQIFSTDEFKELSVTDKYYALTSMSKNVYALQSYYPSATKIQNSVYQKKIKKGQIFLSELSSIYNTSGYIPLPFENLYTTNKTEDDEAKVKTKEIKFKYAFTKFEQKQ